MLKIFMSQFIMYMKLVKKINSLVKDTFEGLFWAQFLDYSTIGFWVLKK
jgi:hypothetical protein